ncbi:hypothetical protein [Gordonia bronchialis]|uniref:hypothetical protein n=1 Tax=Gordonia bronchialis TaxID=2054 RepID=UPI00242CB380|nr:hypothetical protein [Gordonia bronchialis]
MDDNKRGTSPRRRRKSNLETNAHWTLSQEESLLLQCAVDWLPYGRPPDDLIFLRFGVSPTDFAIRLCEVLAEHTLDDIVLRRGAISTVGARHRLFDEYAQADSRGRGNARIRRPRCGVDPNAQPANGESTELRPRGRPAINPASNPTA